MMSRCFTWVPISGLGKPKLYQNMWCFTRMWGFTWRVSDCEELSGGYAEEMIELIINVFISVKPHSTVF